MDHALQCADLANSARASDEAVIAALLHDIGHLIGPSRMEEIGVTDHARARAAFLRKRGFPRKVVELVASHVEAKRYLVAANPDYARMLSPRSVETLALQGGAMTAAEAAAFERDPLFDGCGPGMSKGSGRAGMYRISRRTVRC